MESEKRADAEPKRSVARYQINFDEGMIELLEELRRAYPAYRIKSVTTADVIRDALGFLHWTILEKREGRDLAVLDASGKASRVVLPFFG